MASSVHLLLLFVVLSGSASAGFPPEAWTSLEGDEVVPVPVTNVTFPGTKWVVLITGSSDYGNYRHQVVIIIIFFPPPINLFLSIVFILVRLLFLK